MIKQQNKSYNDIFVIVGDFEAKFIKVARPFWLGMARRTSQ
jgi:hypothetical protein